MVDVGIQMTFGLHQQYATINNSNKFDYINNLQQYI